MVWRIDEDFEMGFVNVEGEDETKKEDLASRKMARGWTPDRVADYFDEEPMWYPLDPVVYGQCEAKYSEEDFDTIEEYKDKVVEEYEEQCNRRGYVKYWSGVGDLPVMCPPMMQIIQAEQAENQQATQPAGQGMPGQEQTMPGQEMQGQPLDPSQMMGQLPPGAQDEAGEQSGDDATMQGADLRPHHFLDDAGSNDEEDDGGDDEDERRKRYAAALKQKLLQQSATRQVGAS